MSTLAQGYSQKLRQLEGPLPWFDRQASSRWSPKGSAWPPRVWPRDRADSKVSTSSGCPIISKRGLALLLGEGGHDHVAVGGPVHVAEGGWGVKGCCRYGPRTMPW